MSTTEGQITNVYLASVRFSLQTRNNTIQGGIACRDILELLKRKKTHPRPSKISMLVNCPISTPSIVYNSSDMIMQKKANHVANLNAPLHLIWSL